jgi:30S ribosomal protein S31
MGKGDKKSRRGKLFQGSYGVRRRKKKNSPVAKPVAAVEKETEVKTVKPATPEAKPAKAAPPKKAPAKHE